MIITPEQYIDDDYFSPEIINVAEIFIKEINIILNNYKYNSPELLEFNVYLNAELLKFKRYVNSDTYTYEDYGGLKSGVVKYIILKFTESGWIISQLHKGSMNFKIEHPKFATFK